MLTARLSWRGAPVRFVTLASYSRCAATPLAEACWGPTKHVWIAKTEACPVP